MTITESLILVLAVALWSTGNGVSLANNTTIIVLLMIALVALSFSTSRSRCQNSFVNSQNGLFGLNQNLFS